MIALALSLVLVAEADTDVPREHRISVAPALLVVLPVNGIAADPVAFESVFKFEVLRALRVIAVGSIAVLHNAHPTPPDLTLAGMLGSSVTSALVGAEGLVTPALPVELGGGGAIGVAMYSSCASDSCVELTLQGHAQVRAFAGYRFNDWVSAAFLATFNVPLATGLRPWFESGAQLSVHL